MLEESSERKKGTKSISHDESATSKNEKCNNRGANIFLMNKHPELFDILPRPGGYLKHLAPPMTTSRTNVDKSGNKPNKSVSNASNENRSLNRATIGEILETSIRCPSARRPFSKEDQKNNTVRMCSIAISTVMMLAQHIYEDITSEHVKHTEEYFRGLKQVNGYPHNVGQLLQLLTHLKKTGRIATPSMNENEDIEEEIYFDSNNTIEMSDLMN